MPESKHGNLDGCLSPYAEAFLDVLRLHENHVISQADLEEYFPDLSWKGNVAMTWLELKARTEYPEMLWDLGNDRSRMYALVTDPELFQSRIESTLSELEEPDISLSPINDEVLSVDPKIIKRWKKIAAAAVTVSAAVATTAYAVKKKRK